MKILQQCKFGVGISPVDTNATTTLGTAFDLSSGGPFSEVMCVIQTGNVAANMDELSVQESATSGGSYVAIAGATFTAPTAASGDNKIYVCYVPVGGTRKGFLKVNADGGAGATLVSALWIGIPGATPTSDTERGTAETLFPTA